MKSVLGAVALLVAAHPVWGADVNDDMTRYAQEQMQRLVSNPKLIDAVRAHNADMASVSDAALQILDQGWRAEVDGADRQMIAAVLNSPLSQDLVALVAQSDGQITEILIMGARGMNVAQSAVTSDYWQGDEKKYTETVAKGPQASYASEITLDESTQAYQGQVSISIQDPETGASIGAITFGINAAPFY